MHNDNWLNSCNSEKISDFLISSLAFILCVYVIGSTVIQPLRGSVKIDKSCIPLVITV